MRKIKDKKYHYFYKITNLINNHFYYGIHSTNNLEDGYMGSGARLHRAYDKYGIENFEKEILKFFDSREECSNYEIEMVTEELIHDNNCYNIVGGGDTFATSGTVTVKDNHNNYFQISKYDDRWINSEVVGLTKGYTNCYDTELNKYTQIPNEEFSNNRERYRGLTSGYVIAKLKDEEKFYPVPIEEFNKNKQLYITVTTNKITCKDKYGNYFSVYKNDPRVLSGELVNMWCNRKHKDETKKKMRNTHKLNRHQQGEKNSQYGTCWIYKDGENKKIKKDELELYIQDGWTKGRKMK